MWKNSIMLLQGQPANTFVIYASKPSALSKEVQPTYLVQCILLVRWWKKKYMNVAEVFLLHIK